MPPTPGYSGTPLSKKLGLKQGSRVLLIDAPEDYARWVAPAPSGVDFKTKAAGQADIVHLFVSRRAVLSKHLSTLRDSLPAQASIWISWPKKASKVPTDISEETIRELALPLGFVDIKVCAVTEVWSGLKLVLRKALR